MAVLDIILEGDPRLRQKSTRIKNVDAGLRKLATDMRDTMLAAPGVGLAAPQVGVNRRLIVVHVPEDFDHDGEPELNLALVNPEIVRSLGSEIGSEGCLSIPGWAGDVARAEAITIKAMDMNNRDIRIKLRGYAARVVQHEIDHLDGVLFVDKLEPGSLRRVEDDDELADPAEGTAA
jgi:peptide deformylase